MFSVRFFACAVLASVTFTHCGKAPPVMAVKLHDDALEITQFAVDPLIQNPIGLTIDQAGRLLVIESHTHHRPKDWKGPAHDQIVWLKDTDGDGKADVREVIFDETDATMDIATAPDGSLYVSTRNEILRLSEQGPDGKPKKVQRKLVRLESANQYPHNELSSLAFDRSGGFYFGIGENYGAAYKLSGSDGSSVSDQGEGGNIWHVTNEGKDLRRVATGFWNPFGLCVDAWGNVFATDNDPNSCPPCRLHHIVQDGDYGYAHRYGRSGLHPFISWNAELPGTLPMLASTGEAPCAVRFYSPAPTTAFMGLGARWQGALLTACWGGNRVESYRLTPKNGTFQVVRTLLCEGGADFRPVGIVTAADGSIYISDWVKRDYELHGKGRIWRIAAKSPSLLEKSSVKPYPADLDATLRERILSGPAVTEAEAQDWLGSTKPYLSAAAMTRLSREPALLQSLLSQPASSSRIEAGLLLALRAATAPEPGAGAATVTTSVEPMLQRFLMSEDPKVVMVGLKWISDKRLVAMKPVVEALLKDARSTSEVYFAAMTALARMDSAEADETALVKLLKQDIANPDISAKRKRLALEILPDRNRNITAAEVLPQLGPAKTEDKVWLIHFLGTLWEPKKKGVMSSLTGLIGLNKNTPAQHLHAIATDVAAEPAPRIAALLQSTIKDGDVEPLLQLATNEKTDQGLRVAVLQALQGKGLSETQKQSIDLIESPALKPLVARLLGNPFFPATRPDAKSTSLWRAYLDGIGGSPNIENGRNVFMSGKLGGCVMCHRADGIGQQAGPNLATIFNTLDPDYALESLLQPSRNISPQFESFMITTRDGQTQMGFEINDIGDSLNFINIIGETFSVKFEDIISRTVLPTSIMPEGIVSKLTDAEVRDLLAFLQSQGGRHAH
jgi:putative membrane-bound dehydrogenase-like protein